MMCTVLVLYLFAGVVSVSREDNSRALLRILLGTFPIGQHVDGPLSSLFNNYPAQELAGFLKVNGTGPGYKARVRVGKVEPLYNPPLWCMDLTDYNMYSECRLLYHNVSVQDENTYLFHATGLFQGLSLNFTQPSSGSQRHPMTLDLVLGGRLQLFIFVKFTFGVCRATLTQVLAQLCPKHVTLWASYTNCSLMGIQASPPDELRNFYWFTPWWTVVDRLVRSLETFLADLIPESYTTHDLSYLMCNSI